LPFRTSHEDAANIFNADDVFSIDQLASSLKSIIGYYSNVFVDVPSGSIRKRGRSTTKSLLRFLSSSSEFDSIVEALLSSRRKPLAPEVARLRAVKSPCEQRIMRAAADISGSAHAKVWPESTLSYFQPHISSRFLQTMRFSHPGLSEAALAAHFEYLCCLAGAQRLAYVPVVASGYVNWSLP